MATVIERSNQIYWFNIAELIITLYFINLLNYRRIGAYFLDQFMWP